MKLPEQPDQVSLDPRLKTGVCARSFITRLVDSGSLETTTDDQPQRYIGWDIERHGIAGLATAPTYAVDRNRGQTTHRRMVQPLDLFLLEAETIRQALRLVVHEHADVEPSGALVADLDDGDQEAASVAETKGRGSTRTASERFGAEDLDE